MRFDVFKMYATFHRWVRRLMGKPSVPYNCGLSVRGWSHPLIYDDVLSIAATKSKAFREVLHGQTVWQGNVDVFDLPGHPMAKLACARAHLDGEHGGRTRYVAVLEIPPVNSAETAVRVSVVKEIRNKK
jgi:hypothetical protein